MKILICTGVYPPDIGGPATYSKLLFEELPEKGVEVEVLSFGEVRHLPKVIRHFAYFINTLKKAKGVDLVYAQDPVSVGMPSCLASKILGKKFVLKVVGDYAWEQYQQRGTLSKFSIFNFQFSKTKEPEFVTPEDFQNQKFDFVTEVRRKIERRVAKKADKVVVPSRYLKKIVTMWNVPEDKIEVVYNAFASKEILESKEELRKQFGFEDTDFTSQNGQRKIIFSVGRLVPWKGFETLIEVMKDFPNFKLLIAGDGPDKEKLEEKVKDLGLGDRVSLLGRLEQVELLKQIKASDVFVLNTGYEGLSHQLLEVMSLGTPIVTTNIGGNPEVIENGKEGLLVEYNDGEKIKTSISFVMNNKTVVEGLAKNAKEKLKTFNREKMLGEIAEVLKRLVG